MKMKDRSLRNDDIEGSKPKSFISRKHHIKSQYQSQIFGNQPICIDHEKAPSKKRSPEKTYKLINNIYGFDLHFLESNNELAKGNPIVEKGDSLDRFALEFQKKKIEFPQLNKEDNFKEENMKKLNQNIARFYGVTPTKTPNFSFLPMSSYLNSSPGEESHSDIETKLRNALLREMMKNDKSLEKNMNSFFGEEEYEKKSTNDCEKSSSKIPQEFSKYSLFLNMQKELERAKNKFQRREFNLITGEKY